MKSETRRRHLFIMGIPATTTTTTTILVKSICAGNVIPTNQIIYMFAIKFHPNTGYLCRRGASSVHFTLDARISAIHRNSYKMNSQVSRITLIFPRQDQLEHQGSRTARNFKTTEAKACQTRYMKSSNKVRPSFLFNLTYCRIRVASTPCNKDMK